MGVIQSAINQTLGTVGIAARLSPGLETRAEIRAAQKTGTQLRETTTQLSKEVPNISERIQAEADIGLQEKRIEQAKKEQELGLRTPGSAAAVIRNEKKGMQIAKLLENKKVAIKPYSAQDLLKDRQKQAMQKVANKQDAAQEQKNRFMSWLKEQPTNLGGKIGDLAPTLQEKIYQQLAQQKENKK